MKEQMKKYIELLIENAKAQEPYYEILNDNAKIYTVVYNTEQFIADLFGIPEDLMDYLIREYVSWVRYDGDCKWLRQPPFDENDNDITTIDELVDCVIRNMEVRNA